MRELFSETESFINEYRAKLTDTSLTARAIDRNDSWTRIALIARQEGHEFFALYLEQAHCSWNQQPQVRVA